MLLQVKQARRAVRRGGSARAQRVVLLLGVLGRCHGATVLRQGWGEEAGVRRLPEGGEQPRQEQGEGEGAPSQEVTWSHHVLLRFNSELHSLPDGLEAQQCVAAAIPGPLACFGHALLL